MKIVYPPNKYSVETGKQIKIFLAGSIEMGKAVDWQTQVIEGLKGLDVTILNPRRKDWDSSWKQTPDFKPFNEQVNWEMDGIAFADLVLVNFDENTQSPVTLMELGYILGRFPKKALVCCPKKFHRHGNVVINCGRENVKVYEDLGHVISLVKGVVMVYNKRNP